jgi:hypothetical protein
MSNKPEPTRQFLNDPTFQGFHQRIALHEDLLRKIKANLPEIAARHCLYCVAKEDGSLLLYTDSQAFATQFRFYAPTILAKLNAGGNSFIKQIGIRNLNLDAPPASEKAMPPMHTPSTETIKAVKASSATAGDDELGKALARLAASMERYAANKKP